MRGVKKNTRCIKCGKVLDRVGDICHACRLRSSVKARQKVNRDNRQIVIQLKQMKKETYDKILKEVNKELDQEENAREIQDKMS